MAQAFNHYFTNIAAKVDVSLFLSPTDAVEVGSIISELEKGKSVGPCSIPCNLYKMLNPFISPLLATLINESFSTGVFQIN